jgi:glycosyltransferase involved in cell wall biosynthesis
MESITNEVAQIRKTNSVKARKVLWFATSPSLSRVKLDGSYNVGTSWIEAMEELVHEETNIDLAIAFIWKRDKLESFQIEGSSTTYFAIPRRPKNKLANFVRHSLCLAEPKIGVNDYLQVIEEFKPDIINFFGTENPFPLVLEHVNIPHIIWFQGNLTVYHQKWHAGISWIESLLSESIKDLIMAKAELNSFLSNYQFVKREQKIFKLAQNFIGRTNWDNRLVRTMAPQAKYHHCEEVMRKSFHDQSWIPKRSREKYILVSTFRDNLYKGLEVAMSAYMALAPLLDRPLEWRIIGVPEKSQYARVCYKVSGLKSASGFKLLGTMPAENIILELLNADVFVHPSHIDNSPNSLCEAMMIGLPIVSTNVGGIPSIVADGIEGLLVQNGDAYAMAGAILQLLQEPDAANSLARQARRRALIRHDRKKIIADLQEIYEAIMSAHSVTNS